MQTIITPTNHSEDEHALVRLLSTDSTAQAVALQTRLQTLLGNAIWLQRPPALHCTLMEIICDATYTSKTRKQYFDEWYAAYDELVREILSSIEPFDITFTELLVSQRAIIIKTSDSTAMNMVRAALLARTKLPAETKIPPSITHCSLARFTRVLDLETVRQLVADIPVDISEHVSEFVLMKDLGPPDFNGVPLKTYPLRQR